jgi:hypothetical protein
MQKIGDLPCPTSYRHLRKKIQANHMVAKAEGTSVLSHDVIVERVATDTGSGR